MTRMSSVSRPIVALLTIVLTDSTCDGGGPDDRAHADKSATLEVLGAMKHVDGSAVGW